MIEGLNVRSNVGPVEILRSPYIELVYKRRAVISRAVIHIPDAVGDVRAALSTGQTVKIRFGYRGETNLWHEWEGTVEAIDQPERREGNMDALAIRCAGLEKALTATRITESFYDEPASIVASRLLSRTGLPVAGIDIPDVTLRHQVFSNVPVARALKQMEQSLTRSFGHDMSRHAVWLGADGLRWSAGDEPGAAISIETGHNLIEHTPPVVAGSMGKITSVLLPGLTDGRQVVIRDVRRQVTETVRAQEVIHILKSGGNATTVLYGKESGWGA